MYESTPQHIVDAESTPGPAAAWLDTSSSDSSSSSSSDSDDSSGSEGTIRKRMRKVLRSRRRRSSVVSVESNDTSTLPTRTPSMKISNLGNSHETNIMERFPPSHASMSRKHSISAEGSEVAVEEEKSHRRHRRHKKYKHHKKHKKHGRKPQSDLTEHDQENLPIAIGENANDMMASLEDGTTRRVDFAVDANEESDGVTTHSRGRRPFPGLRGMSVRNLAPAVFIHGSDAEAMPAVPTGPVPRVRYGIRRTNSLPDRLNQYQFRPPGAMLPSQIPLMALTGGNGAETAIEEPDDHLSRTSAVILLLISTALVAVCAEFLVDSINEVVHTGSVKEIFIGLIILPIVGNAAEHVTAITVAMKNKMDLSIGVAVGSSIQIALFITPLVVILGWIMNRDMTLYFTLFETVALFVSAFIVNFLVLDGRSNYLEGALLCSTYIIISVVAFYYPEGDDASDLGGGISEATSAVLRLFR
jgi:Ca2+/H+ antiporter